MQPLRISNQHRISAASVLVLALVVLLTCHQPRANSQQPAASQQPPVPDYLSFTRRIPNGLVNVGALELPESFLQRVADRSLRSHFRGLFRQVDAPESASTPAAHAEGDGAALPANVRIVEKTIAQETLAPWASAENDVPELRGFRAPLSPGDGIEWAMNAPERADDPRTRAAALFVAESLASQGLVRTTLEAIRTQEIVEPGQPITMQRLASIGIPVDLLAMFTVAGQPFVDAMQQWWNDGGAASGVNSLADRARLEFRATHPRFKAFADDGTQAVSRVRMQIPSTAFIVGEGDGSSIDVLRQLACADHDWDLLVTAHANELATLRKAVAGWPIDANNTLTIVTTIAYTSQWAQDNARTGLVTDENGKLREATLIPRFACVNEQMSKWAAADSLIVESLRDELGVIIHSPLLFEGGNVMVVTMPKGGDRVLLIGEAEVYRNQALGLSERDVLAAFRRELSVDRCVIMPAVSFHIDMEFNVRRVGDELIASVGDDVRAAQMILAAAIRALQSAGIVEAGQAQPALDELEAGGNREALLLLSGVIPSYISQEGKITGKIVEALRTSPVDVPDAAMARVMHALDLLTAVEARKARAPISPNFDHERLYRESLLRRLDARNAQAKQLEELGMRVVRIPNLGDEELGVNVLNAVHTPTAAFIPTTGGIFSAVDEAAIKAYASAYGEGVAIVPITTTYVQSRYGGVHCMVSPYPAAELE